MISWNISGIEEKAENAPFSGSKIDNGDKALCSMEMCYKGTSSWDEVPSRI